MRTDNRAVKNTIISIYFIFFIGSILLATVFKTYDVFPKSALYVFVGLLVIIILVHYIARYFEYDSDGTDLIITNKGLILTDYINFRQKKVEFAKHKLVDYKIYSYLIYKMLVISIRDNNKVVNESFNITLLKRRKLKYVKQSLRKILKQNRKSKKDMQNEI